ncbi:MAG TPA: crosslink repair DNA glycosylase YcaQ family protein, partial [Micromonosporaceae bacterium]|nr:crosslink repair DNA glycosylase YcaQ family protein [Micromonosporaceae bacterium]
MDVAASAARRFLVSRQLLAPARSVEGGPGGVLAVFRRLGSIQFDPLSVAGRNHYLVLHARVAGYDPAWCDGLYERRELFEAYNKGLSLVLTRDLPWFRASLRGSSSRILAEHADVAEHVLERVRAEGPLSALDFERRRGSLVDWFGAPTNVVRAVLEAYALTGVLGLARRDGNRRYYDLIERLLPADVLGREVPLREQMRHKLLSRYRTHGLLGIGGGGD